MDAHSNLNLLSTVSRQSRPQGGEEGSEVAPIVVAQSVNPFCQRFNIGMRSQVAIVCHSEKLQAEGFLDYSSFKQTAPTGFGRPAFDPFCLEKESPSRLTRSLKGVLESFDGGVADNRRGRLPTDLFEAGKCPSKAGQALFHRMPDFRMRACEATGKSSRQKMSTR